MNKVIKYRSQLYYRYMKNLQSWSKDFFSFCNKIKHNYKYNFHAFTIILKKNEREKFLKYLKKNNIIAFISFEALHLSDYGRKLISKKTNLNNTNLIIRKIVRLPMHNQLKIHEVDYICKKVKDYFSN